MNHIYYGRKSRFNLSHRFMLKNDSLQFFFTNNNIKHMKKFFFVSFASTDMKPALIRIGKQARDFNLFDEIKLYTEKMLPQYAKDRCKAIIKQTGTRRGYAYWSWKPVIINENLRKMQDGDILIYSDAGTHMNPKGKTKLLEYIKMAEENDIWVIQLEESLPDINWTKRDTIDFFRKKITDSEKISEFDKKIKNGQLEGGTLIITKNNYTVHIAEQWEEYMSIEHLHLFDDSASSEKEIQSFRENRHDQSVLSLLLKSNHYASTSTDHFHSHDTYPQGKWKELIESEPFLRVRDKKPSLTALLHKKAIGFLQLLHLR